MITVSEDDARDIIRALRIIGLKQPADRIQEQLTPMLFSEAKQEVEAKK